MPTTTGAPPLANEVSNDKTTTALVDAGSRLAHPRVGTGISLFVALTLAGGLTCVSTVTAGEALQGAATKSHLYLAYALMVAVEGAVAWSGIAPMLGKLRPLWRGSRWRTRLELLACLCLLVGAVAAYLYSFHRMYPLNLNWGLGDKWALRFVAADAIVFIPSLLPILTMWFSAVAASSAPPSPTPSEVVEEFLTHQAVVQDCLWFLGAILGSVLLTNGMLREAMLDAKYTTKEVYPPVLIATNGAFFTVCIATCYAPAYALLRGRALEIKLALLVDTRRLETWGKKRKQLATLLGLEMRLDRALKDGLAILAPVLGTLASSALPQFFK